MLHCGLSREQYLLQPVQKRLPRYWVRDTSAAVGPLLVAGDWLTEVSEPELARLILLADGGSAAVTVLSCLRPLPRALELVTLGGGVSPAALERLSGAVASL